MIATRAHFVQQAVNALNDQRAEDAELVSKAGLALHPNTPELQSSLTEALLMQGRYREGFREYEGRFHRQDAPPRRLPYPEWDGPVAGRSILVWGEQGIGDEIQTVRFLRQLKELGASRVTLACWPQSVRAFQNLGADEVISRQGDMWLPKHDCWAISWSLPYRLGIGIEDISGAPYLQAERKGRGGVGLVESGRPGNGRDADRSMPEGLLQAAFPQGQLMKPDGDVYDALCRVAALDLLITVDTSWAHMAGALGVPCWVLLPFRQLDWRWMRDRSDTPWYDSLRLFRQPTAGDWGAVLDQVRSEFAAR